MNDERLELAVDQLCNCLNADELGFETTRDLPPVAGVLGQERAVRALEFALQVDAHGYHVYAAGPEGTGKMTAIHSILARIKRERPTPLDWCYVHNFENPDQPRALTLPPGRGQELERDMRRFVEAAKDLLPRVFEGEGYARRRAAVLREFETQRQAMTRQLEEDARRQGFAIEATPAAVVTIPLVEGRPLSAEEFNRLPEAERNAIEERGNRLKEALEAMLRRGHLIEEEARERVEQLDHEVAGDAVDSLLSRLDQKYADLPDVAEYLRQVRADVPKHLGDFRPPPPAGHDGTMEVMLREDRLLRYRVNLFVDHSRSSGAPTIVEDRPSYYNLFGRLDYRVFMGNTITDFTMIKPGAIHRANGGFLVLQARDVLANPLVWETLKRTLRSREAGIENMGEQQSAVPTATLRPQRIPIAVKVILVGPPLLYYLLNEVDEDFSQLFGVRADFDLDVERNEEHVAQYAGLISSFVQRDRLRPFHKSAVARVIDYASRVANHQQRLTTRFDTIARLVREASYWAAKQGHDTVMADDVQHARAEQDYRTSLLEDRLRQLITEETVHIATEGMVTGQVNGLSVIDLGHHPFGRPARISASTALGSRGIVAIEREIALSGRIHSKGVLIIAGYLAAKYAQDKPLALSASITFEQTYDEVEGDSASSAELYALLSSLAGLPLKQGIAVTGAINQRGEVQAIGGVNEKIEGFFKVCLARGLTGQQGVIIPRDNVKHLMLDDEVVRAVRERKFHIWAIKTVDEGISLLSGLPAGEPRADGTYLAGTVHYLVDRQLRAYAEHWRRYRSPAAPGRAAPPLGAEAPTVARRHRQRG